MKKLVKRLIYPNTYSQEAFIKYLRRRGASVGDYTYFFSPKNIKVDEKRLDYLKIGSYCKITSGVQFLNHDFSWSVFRKYKNKILPNSGYEINIGDNVFIGWNTLIIGPVTIGSNVIIGANSVVTHDIPDNSVYAGNPAKKIYDLDEYLKKKEKNILNQAKFEFLHKYKKNNTIPKQEELGWFNILFIDRDEESEKYLRTLPFNGDNIEEVIEAFYEMPKSFDSYDDFVKYCLKNK